MRKFVLVAVLLATLIVSSYGLVSAQDDTITFEIEAAPDQENPRQVKFWIEWSDSQRLLSEETFMYNDHFTYGSLLVVTGDYSVDAYDLSTAGIIRRIDADFGERDEAIDDSRFFVFDPQQGLIGRYLFTRGTPDSPSYKIEMQIWQISSDGVEQVTADVLPPELNPQQ